MFIDESQCQRMNLLMSHYASELRSPSISFFVHNWGSSAHHYTNRPHQHSFFEICYCIHGSGTYIDQSSEHVLRPGTLFCSRPHVEHQIQSENGLNLLWVGFDVIDDGHLDMSEVYQAMRQTDTFIHYDMEKSPLILLWTSLWTRQHPIHDETLTAALLQHHALALLLSYPTVFVEPKQKQREGNGKRPASYYLYQAQKYIEDNIHHPLKIQEVADHLHLSPRHLSRIFRTCYGIPFSEYVRIKRVEKAKQLLRESDETIEQIGQQTGFRSVHYFSNVFRQYYEMPPGAYRRHVSQSDSDPKH